MVTGSCLCRGIRFEIRGDVGMASMCHCEDCRKAQGSAFAVNAAVAAADVSFVCGAELLRKYESSPGKYRCFCSRCGSPVFSRRDDDAASLRIRLGLVDGDPGVRPVLHAYLDDKAAWERLTYDGLPCLAKGTAESLMPKVRLVAEDPGSADAKSLIAALDEELLRTYPKNGIFGLHDEDHDPSRMVFLVARTRDGAVGCAALRSLDADTGEVKRMYVLPEFRRGALARRLLAAIETIAISRRHRMLRLETGNRSPAALGLYRANGFREIPLYGEYIGNPFSVCFEKKL